MKRVWVMVISAGMLFGACQKEVVPAYMREKPHEAALPVKPMLVRPVLPDTFREPVIPIWPRIPRLPRTPGEWLPVTVPVSQCVNSYEDLVNVIGSGQVPAKGVVLENDVELLVGGDLAAVIYFAVNEQHGSSLFNSQLLIEWRRPGENFQGHFSDVWSLGCVYESSVPGPYTNLKKGAVTLMINTCFFWGAVPYQGLRVKYILLD